MIGRLYVDDSKDGKQKSNFVLAGFHSPVSKWKRFDKSWNSELSKGIGLDYFKSTEASSLRGQFSKDRGWNRQLVDDKINNFTKIIKKHCETCFYVHVNPADFKKQIGSMNLMGGDTLFDRDAYHFLVFMLIQRFYDHMSRTNQKSRQHIIFDSQMGYEPIVAYLWDMMRRWVVFNGLPFQDCSFVGNTPVHRDDKDNTPLQAADLMAWSIRRKFEGLKLENKIPKEALLRLGSIPWIPLSVAIEDMIAIKNLMENDPNYLDVINRMGTTPFRVRNSPKL